MPGEVFPDAAYAIALASSKDLYHQALRLYRERPDKDWGLTDCISLIVMQAREIAEALTGDVHFQQAGFRALLRSET
jgi:hypothetical protein